MYLRRSVRLSGIASLPLLFFFRKSEKVPRNIQIMYFNVFFFFLLRHVYIRGDAVCRTRMVIHGERLARMRWSTVPFAKALIIKVNALLLRRGDDTHTWLKIDAADSFVEDFMENIFLLTLFFLLLRCFSCRRVRLRRK